VSDPLGLARLPSDVTASLDACAAALAACAVQLDAVLGGEDPAALEEMAKRRAASRRAVMDLLAAIAASRRTGPDRGELTELARTSDRTAEAIEAVAYAWTRHPIPEAADVLLALRDATRAAAKAIESLEKEDCRLVWDTRCREREAEARFLGRAARATLLSRQDDVSLAAAAHDLLTYTSLWLAALGRLRAALLRCSFE
jgi:hypothetical protein